MNHGRQSVKGVAVEIPPCSTGFLTSCRDPGGTMSGGEFDSGGRLRKGIEALKVPSEWSETI